MHIKHDYNFFSGQETTRSQTKIQLTIAIIIGVFFIVGAVLLFLWGRASTANDERLLSEAKERLANPEVLAKLQEIDTKQIMVDNLASYTSIAGIVLDRIASANYGSSKRLSALLAELPNSIQVDTLDIQGQVWHLECKTDLLADIAVLIYNLENSSEFMNVMVGEIVTDEVGLSTFPLDMQLDGGSLDEIK